MQQKKKATDFDIRSGRRKKEGNPMLLCKMPLLRPAKVRLRAEDLRQPDVVMQDTTSDRTIKAQGWSLSALSCLSGESFSRYIAFWWRTVRPAHRQVMDRVTTRICHYLHLGNQCACAFVHCLSPLTHSSGWWLSEL